MAESSEYRVDIDTTDVQKATRCISELTTQLEKLQSAFNNLRPPSGSGDLGFANKQYEYSSQRSSMQLQMEHIQNRINHYQEPIDRYRQARQAEQEAIFARRSEASKSGWETRRNNEAEALRRSEASRRGWETRRETRREHQTYAYQSGFYPESMYGTLIASHALNYTGDLRVDSRHDRMDYYGHVQGEYEKQKMVQDAEDEVVRAQQEELFAKRREEYQYEKQKFGASVRGTRLGIRFGRTATGAVSSFAGHASSMAGATNFNYLNPWGYVGAAQSIMEQRNDMIGGAGNSMMGIGGALAGLNPVAGGITAGIGGIINIASSISKMWFAQFSASLNIVKGISGAIITVLSTLGKTVGTLFNGLLQTARSVVGTMAHLLALGGAGIAGGIAGGVSTVSSVFNGGVNYYGPGQGFGAGMENLNRTRYMEHLAHSLYLTDPSAVGDATIGLENKIAAFKEKGVLEGGLDQALMGMLSRMYNPNTGDNLKDLELISAQLGGMIRQAGGDQRKVNRLQMLANGAGFGDVIWRAANRYAEDGGIFNKPFYSYDRAGIAESEYRAAWGDQQDLSSAGSYIKRHISTTILNSTLPLIDMTGREIQIAWLNLSASIVDSLKVGNLGPTMGALRPFVTMGANVWNGTVGALFPGMRSGKMFDSVSGFVSGFRRELVPYKEDAIAYPFGAEVRDATEGKWRGLLDRIYGVIAGGAEQAFPVIQSIWKSVTGLASELYSDAKIALKSFFGSDTAKAIVDWIVIAADGIHKEFESLFDGIVADNDFRSFFADIGTSLLYALEEPVFKFAHAVDVVFGAIGPMFWNLFKHPIMAISGIQLPGGTTHLLTNDNVNYQNAIDWAESVGGGPLNFEVDAGLYKPKSSLWSEMNSLTNDPFTLRIGKRLLYARELPGFSKKDDMHIDNFMKVLRRGEMGSTESTLRGLFESVDDDYAKLKYKALTRNAEREAREAAAETTPDSESTVKNRKWEEFLDYAMKWMKDGGTTNHVQLELPGGNSIELNGTHDAVNMMMNGRNAINAVF